MTINNANRVLSTQRNSLNLNAQVYQQLLHKLNSIPHQQSSASSRQFTRLEYCDPYLDLIIQSGDHSQQRKITVASRNISRGGISILHSSFIYPGSKISTKLRRNDGSTLDITGTIRRCEHRGGIVHEVGIKFDQQIIVHEFIRTSILDSIRSLESLDPTKLNGKVLFIGDDRAIIPKIRQYLLTTNLNFKIASTANEAFEQNYREQDIIFICLDVGEMTGSELTRKFRENGFNRPIILSGSNNNEATSNQINTSNADMFLPTPFTEEQLLCTLGEFLMYDWSDQHLAMLREQDSSECLAKLESELNELANMLEDKVNSNDPVQVYITCTKIRNTSSSLGLKALNDLTSTISDEIAQSGDLSKYGDDLNSILTMCRASNQAA